MPKINCQYRFFPRHPGVQPTDLIVTDVGQFSITRPWDARTIRSVVADAAVDIGIPLDHIVDGTACNGGDTLSFLQAFSRVTAVEMDVTQYAALQHNMKVYGHGNKSYLTLLQDDFTQVYKQLNASVVYLDPPWGGPDYKLFKELMLDMSDQPVDEVVHDILRQSDAKLVAVKVPNNFAFHRFRETLRNYHVRQVPVRNYYLLLVSESGSSHVEPPDNRKTRNENEQLNVKVSKHKPIVFTL